MALAAFGFRNKKSNHQEKSQVADKDFDLVARCQNGERAAQYELYQRYKDWVFNIAFRMANHQQEAEDITQKVFMRLFAKIGTFRGESAFSSWLYRMTANVCLNHFRSGKKKQAKYMQELSEVENKGKTDTGAKNDKFNLQPHLERAIRALPEGYRMVFILYHIEGYNHREIAEIMNFTEGTSKSQLHKARQELKKFIEPYIILNDSL